MDVLDKKDVRVGGAGESNRPAVHIGVLALQGDFQKHLDMLGIIEGVEARIVRTKAEIDWCDGLILPGGESTTIGKLMARYGVDDAIRGRVSKGMTVFGTCTGMILLSKHIESSDQHRLGLMDTHIRRNAFGRQIDSFEADIKIPCIDGSPVRAIFIRAPFATGVGKGVEVLSVLDNGEIIMCRQGNCLAAAFHPELTDDTRVHEYFVEMTREARASVFRN